MQDIKTLLNKLNEEQIKPVLDTEGAVLVIAGAGSGKTRVLTTRIAYLISEKKVLPSEIMAITFTNKAAGEMKERLEDLVGDINGMWVSTIHSMCVKILRNYIDRIGYERNFTIYDETDKDKLLKRIVEQLGLDVEKILKTAKNIISEAKNECLNPEDFKIEYSEHHYCEDLYKIYSAYQTNLMRSNCLDFDDLLFKTYELFANCPDVATILSKSFKYIHIDEFQDTNRVQFEICRSLAKESGNIFVVGDDDQSIYGWRGAKIENILSFDKIYPNVKVYKLERNYRSSKKILQLANSIISKNVKRRTKELWTENDEGSRVETFVATDENSEASYVAIQIKNIMARDLSLKYSDFAVFMRINALSRAFEQEFSKYGIPYTVFGGFRFFERKEIKDVLAYLKLVNNAKDDQSFLRALVCPKRGIGEKTINELYEFSTGLGISCFESVDFSDRTSISTSAQTKLKNFCKLISSFKEYSLKHTVSELIDYILESTGFMLQFEEKTEENLSRKYNISELKNSAEEFCKVNIGATLSDYLNAVTLSSDTDAINDGDVVTIATIHAAKGLEYPVVFLSGCDDGILPISRSIGDSDELEEERRLMYVAVTRAKKRLYLTRANSRYMYGKRDYMMQSRFLKDAQDVLFPEKSFQKSYTKSDYYDKDEGDGNFYSKSGGSGYSSDYAKSFLSGNVVKSQKNVNVSEYKSGVKVKHCKFGDGIIVAVKGSGDNLIVDVAFKGVGIKSLSVKYAPMEIV